MQLPPGIESGLTLAQRMDAANVIQDVEDLTVGICTHRWTLDNPTYLTPVYPPHTRPFKSNHEMLADPSLPAFSSKQRRWTAILCVDG